MKRFPVAAFLIIATVWFILLSSQIGRTHNNFLLEHEIVTSGITFKTLLDELNWLFECETSVHKVEF